MRLVPVLKKQDINRRNVLSAEERVLRNVAADYMTGFSWFWSVPPDTYQNITLSLRPQTVPSVILQIHYSFLIPSFDATESELLIVSLNI